MSKDSLYYVVAWARHKQRTWSGTCWSLYNALCSYFCVEDINISPSLLLKMLDKIGTRPQSDFGVGQVQSNRKKLGKYFSEIGDKINVLQFSEIVEGSEDINSFIYQDISASYIHYLYEYLPKIFKCSGFQMNEKKRIEERELIQKRYYQSCSGIFTMGKWLKDDFINRVGIPSDKVIHVGGGINMDRYLIRNLPKNNNRILFVGRDFERKGGRLVYDAFCRLREEMPNVELHLAGPAKNPIKFGGKGFYYYGNCSYEQLSNLFNKCDIFCMPSYFEAYGLVFIEALTYGLPCIGRNVYEMPYFIKNGDTGLLIEQDDVEELAAKMKFLLMNERIKQNVKEKREWYLKEYSWDTVARRMKSYIEYCNSLQK